MKYAPRINLKLEDFAKLNFVVQLPLIRVINIGTDPDNDVVIPLDTVSGFHGAFYMLKAGIIYYEDFSTNGTEVNERMIKDKRVIIVKNMVLNFWKGGKRSFRITIEGFR